MIFRIILNILVVFWRASKITSRTFRSIAQPNNAQSAERENRAQCKRSLLVRMRESRSLKRHYVEKQIPPLVLFLVSKITAEALWFLKVQQAILTFGPFGVLIILWNLFNFFLIFAEIRFRQKSWYSVNFV